MILSGGIATGIVFGSIALIIILIIILVKIDKAKTDRVRKTSPYFRKILELNNKTSFKTISGSFTRVSNTLSTKRQFDNFNYIKKCDEYIADYLEQFIHIVDGIEYNKKAYKEYSEAFRALKHTDSVELAKQNKMSLASFVKRETKLATAEYIKPVMDYTVTVLASYTSPKGRNSYSWSNSFDYNYIKQTVTLYRPKPVTLSKNENESNKTKTIVNKNNTNYRSTRSPRISKPINSIDDLEEID